VLVVVVLPPIFVYANRRKKNNNVSTRTKVKHPNVGTKKENVG
jgi:hypothetical protein